MGITNWKTWASGDTLTAADMNTYVRDNGRWLSSNTTGGAPRCRVYNTAALSITTGTLTALGFDSERYDQAGLHDTATNNSRLTVPAASAGLYLSGGHINWAANSDSTRRILQIRTNGATIQAGVAVPAISNAGQSSDMTVVTLVSLAVADYLELMVRQDTGSNLNVSAAGNSSPEFWALWMGE